YAVTTVHHPAALAATCRALGLAPPAAGTFPYEGREAFGWVVRLPGLRHPVVCDTLTGLVAYHPADNAFGRYAHLMRFLLACYDAQARLRRRGSGPAGPQRRRRVPVGEVA